MYKGGLSESTISQAYGHQGHLVSAVCRRVIFFVKKECNLWENPSPTSSSIFSLRPDKTYSEVLEVAAPMDNILAFFL